MATRRRILATAASLISRYGCAATNIQLIWDTSGVTRGSILHQFPTRLDLLVGVMKYAAEQIMSDTAATLSQISDPHEKLASYADIMWKAATHELMIVLTEIQDAAQWDIDLAGRIRSENKKIIVGVRASFNKVAKLAGVADVDSLLPHFFTMTFALGGLERSQRAYETSKLTGDVLPNILSNWRVLISTACNAPKPRKKAAARQA